MESEKYAVWVLLRHYWKQGINAVAATKKIYEVEGEGLVNIRLAQRWCARFKSRDTGLNDNERLGRPSKWNVDATKQISSEIPTLSTRQLSRILGPSKDTIYLHLKIIDKTYRNGRIIAHEFRL